MGSVHDDNAHPPINVLITGFGPFKQDYPVNPSWEIVRSLPEWLPPLRAKAVPNHPATATTTPGHPTPNSTASAPAPAPVPVTIPPVRLLVHPAPIRVNYTTVRDLVPQLWAEDDTSSSSSSSTITSATDQTTPRGMKPHIDLAIHVGMAGPRLFYSIERRGHRDGYVMPDVDGQLLRDDDARRARRGEGWVWEGMPGELETELGSKDQGGGGLEEVLGRWRGHAPKHMDLRISEDAGHYLCDFIYFSSLAHLYKTGRKGKVLFLHVPSDASDHSVAMGRELLLQLVRAVVESEVAARARA